jgi:protocatechuate 3,4-dioxygenase beta subunit
MRRAFIALGGLALGIAGLGVLGVLAWKLLDAGSPPLPLAPVDSGARAEALAATSTDADSSRRSDSDSSLAAERRDVGDLLLAPPDREQTRLLEQQGRALFWGLVLDPAGAPCPDATIFHQGKAVATSDARGAWRIEVVHDVAAAFGNGRTAPLLIARKERVGIAVVELVGRSRRIDLSLEPGVSLRGRCFERQSKRAVPGAVLTFRFFPDRQHDPVVGFELEAEADTSGEFALGMLVPGSFLVRAVAEEWETGGFESLAFDAGRSRPYEIPMDPRLTVRGWFTPWPLPAAGGAAARVFALPELPHRNDDREFGGAVGEDGRFRFRLPSTRRVDLLLAAGPRTYWKTRIDLEEAPHDLDLGKIELGSFASGHVRVLGRFVAPPEILALGLVANAHCWGGPSSAREDFEIGPDGGFETTLPLPNETLRFERFRIGRSSPAAGWFDDSKEIVLGAATDVELPPIAIVPHGILVHGSVTDDRGEPLAESLVALEEANLARPIAVGVERILRQSKFAGTDSRGWFLCLARPTSAPGASSIVVQARGWAAQTFEVELPSEPGFVRRDLQLSSAPAVQGRLVDETGAALGGWHVTLLDERQAGLAWEITDANGSFTLHGVTPQRCTAQLLPDSATRYDLPPFEVTTAPLLLRVDLAAAASR